MSLFDPASLQAYLAISAVYLVLTLTLSFGRITYPP